MTWADSWQRGIPLAPLDDLPVIKGAAPGEAAKVVRLLLDRVREDDRQDATTSRASSPYQRLRERIHRTVARSGDASRPTMLVLLHNPLPQRNPHDLPTFCVPARPSRTGHRPACATTLCVQVPVISLSRSVELLYNGWGLLGTSSASVVCVVPAVREAGRLNEPLQRALMHARLREVDVAARLGVDPKTVRRWLNGRVPYARYRAELADLVGADEADLWPGVGGPLSVRARPEELGAIYPHRWAIPREVWTHFFESAEREIGILAYSALFLAEDAGILSILADKARHGVTVRISLGDPDSPNVKERGEEEGIGDAMTAKIRNALSLYRPLCSAENIQIHLHQTTLYNSIYRADDQIIVNQHTFGIPAAHSPAFNLHMIEGDDMFNGYLASFEHIWADAAELC